MSSSDSVGRSHWWFRQGKVGQVSQQLLLWSTTDGTCMSLRARQRMFHCADKSKQNLPTIVSTSRPKDRDVKGEIIRLSLQITFFWLNMWSQWTRGHNKSDQLPPTEGSTGACHESLMTRSYYKLRPLLASTDRERLWHYSVVRSDEGNKTDQCFGWCIFYYLSQ